MSWHSTRLDGKTVSGTDFGDRMGRGSGQFAASALDTLSAACNRDTGKPALSRTRVGGLREWERALRPFGVSLSIAIRGGVRGECKHRARGELPLTRTLSPQERVGGARASVWHLRAFHRVAAFSPCHFGGLLVKSRASICTSAAQKRSWFE